MNDDCVIHELKIEAQWADAKLRGDKLFEIRLNDRGFQKGDFIHYTVVESRGAPGLKVHDHALSKCLFQITYVQWYQGLEPGYVVLGEKPVSNP